jgi:integrating conjugative element protein (TIGR03761 family)
MLDSKIEAVELPEEVKNELEAQTENNGEAKAEVTKQTKPGRITAKATIILQTKPAQRLFMNSTGVTEFSKRVNQIWQAASQDDPYADLFLLRIYDILVQTRRKLAESQEKYKQLLLDAEDGVKLNIGESTKPMEFPLDFRTPYGYMASYMLADFDKLTRLFFTLRQLGLVDGYFSEVLNEANQWVKDVLNKPSEWQFTGVTRQDMLEKNQRANKAIELMGKISPKIVQGKLRAPHAPVIKKSEV